MGTVEDVRIAKRTGFCYGVREAIDKAKESASAGKATHTLGQVVHNEGVIRDLQQIGVESVESLDDVDHGAAVVIRAHGVKPEVFERAEARGLEVIDGTCTWVIQEQRQLEQLVEDGYTVVLLGTPKHPEVVGLLGFAPDAIVVDEEEDWDRIPRRKRMALITQSTQPPWKFEKLAAFMVSRAHELKVVNSVCPVTIRRQEDTLETARDVDLMVVVGGRHSANTKELTRLCQIVGTAAIQVENARDLDDAAPFDGARDRRRHRRHLDADRGPARRRRADLRPRRHRPDPRQRRRARARRAGRRGAPGRPHHLPAVEHAPPRLPPSPPARSRPWPAPPACRSSPSSDARTSARARCSTASSATRGRRSSRTAPGRPATACTATPSGTGAGSWSWTPAGSRSRPATRSRRRSSSRRGSRSTRRT